MPVLENPHGITLSATTLSEYLYFSFSSNFTLMNIKVSIFIVFEMVTLELGLFFIVNVHETVPASYLALEKTYKGIKVELSLPALAHHPNACALYGFGQTRSWLAKATVDNKDPISRYCRYNDMDS
jgi:hypothetical protein